MKDKFDYLVENHAWVLIPKEELPPDSKSPWYLFNDFLVRNITEEEALGFEGVWKWPSVIMYKKVLSERRTTSLSQSIRSIHLDPWLLFNDFSLTQFQPAGPRDPRKIQHASLKPTDLPLAKKMVAIDATDVDCRQNIPIIKMTMMGAAM